MHNCAFFEQSLNDFERRREANVVRIGFEGQAEHGNMFALYHPKRLVDFFKKTVDTLLVDALRGFQDIEIDSHGGREMDEGLHILGKAKAAKPKPALRNCPPMRGSKPMA